MDTRETICPRCMGLKKVMASSAHSETGDGKVCPICKGSGADSTPEASALPVVAYYETDFDAKQDGILVFTQFATDYQRRTYSKLTTLAAAEAEIAKWKQRLSDLTVQAINKEIIATAEISALKQQLAAEKKCQEDFAKRVMGEEAYNNSPCQAHPLQLAELTIEQQLAERNADAERYKFLRSQHEATTGLRYDADGFPMAEEPLPEGFTVFMPGKDVSLEPVSCLEGELDKAIDSALAAQGKEGV